MAIGKIDPEFIDALIRSEGQAFPPA